MHRHEFSPGNRPGGDRRRALPVRTIATIVLVVAVHELIRMDRRVDAATRSADWR